MIKKIYALSIILMCVVGFYLTQKAFWYNKIDIISAEDKEATFEKIFPFSDYLKEIYGLSNLVLSPNEIISAGSVTVKDKDGFLLPLQSSSFTMTDYSKNKISELNDFCHSIDKEFAFIYYPSKSDENVIPSEYGVDTNLEEIRYDFLEYLDENNIDYLHVRELLEQDGFSTKDIFYKTDHHWTTNAGLYAARAITNFLNDRYGYNLNESALDEDRFTYTTYQDLWLGETGRKLSLTWVGALDDFTQIMPKYKTSISQINAAGEEKSGDFSIMVDEKGYQGDLGYYNYSAHYSYSEGMDSPSIYHNNLSDENGKKILIIKDSFSVVVIPFLTLTTSDIIVWDMRIEATKEGLYDYIRENDIDVVLLAYTDFWAEHMWNFN